MSVRQSQFCVIEVKDGVSAIIGMHLYGRFTAVGKRDEEPGVWGWLAGAVLDQDLESEGTAGVRLNFD